MTSKMKIAVAAAAVVMVAAPAAAFAQESYDGYCYAKNNKNTGTAIGAIAGGLLGSQVSKNERGLGAVVGAVAGGALGRKIASDGTKCLNGEYYSFRSGYYNPAQPPEGYEVVYFQNPPKADAYSVVYYDTNRRTTPGYAYSNSGAYNSGSTYQGQPYYSSNSSYNTGTQGWRDDKGTWRTGRPVALGWKDSKGRWHEGQVAAYGYRDASGNWREESAPSYGYNSGYYYNNGN